MTDFFESRLGVALTTLLLVALMIYGLSWFGIHVVQLVVGLAQRKEVIDFDKGAIYMLGGGIMIIALLIATIPKVFFKKDLPEAAVEWLGRSLWAGFVIMIVLPHLVHFGIWTALKNRDYVICHDLGSRWLMHVTFVYTSSAEKCLELVVTGR